jgi:type 1 glutamine amidotransferase
MCTSYRLVWVVLFVVALVRPSHADDKSPKLPRGFALEEQPKDPKAVRKVVFIAGSNFFKPGEHEYIAGCAVLMDLVRQTDGVFPVLALDWPKDPKTFENAASVVFFTDGADKHPVLKGDRAAQLQKLVDSGVGLVLLHQGVDVPKEHGDRMRSWAGAAWEKGHSQRAHWVETYKSFPKPRDGAEDSILRGVKPFTIDDGYLYKLRFGSEAGTITHLLKTVNPKTPGAKLDESAVVAWALERKGGGRSFAFTGGHLHVSFAEAGYRRFLTNAILWTANVKVPESGAPVELTAPLASYLAGQGKRDDKSP